MASATIDIHFVMVDGWHRPVFVDKHKNFYGSTGKLFSRDVTEHEVLGGVTEEDITFFGRKFGCEPMGTPAGNVKIIRKNTVEVELMACTLSDKELIETAKSLIDGLCQSGGKTWTMRVPVDFDRDHDIILSEVVKRFEDVRQMEKDATIRQLVGALKFMRWHYPDFMHGKDIDALISKVEGKPYQPSTMKEKRDTW